MSPELRNVAGPSSQKLKLADASDRSATLGRIGDSIDAEGVGGVGPDPVADEARFCDWAFSMLGHVTVFRFVDSGFMLLAENGERTRGETLALALQAMLERQGCNGRRLVYPAAARVERAA